MSTIDGVVLTPGVNNTNTGGPPLATESTEGR